MIRFATSLRFLSWQAAAIVAAAVWLSSTVIAADVPPAATPEQSKPVSFHADVLPILQAKCQGCHQPAKAGGNLDLTMFKNLLSAGESGTFAVVPGKPSDSELLNQITPGNGEAAMPKDKQPLAATEIELIRRWIEEGANDDTPAETTPPIDAATTRLSTMPHRLSHRSIGRRMANSSPLPASTKCYCRKPIRQRRSKIERSPALLV
jgi:hypothetical protein